MLRTFRLLSLSLLTIALGAACGAAATPAATPAPATATIAATTVATPAAAATSAPLALNVSAVEQSTEKYVFDPSAITVKVGQAVTVHYSNPSTSQWPHTFVIKSADGKSELVKSEQVRPGNALDISFTIPEAGTFQLLCIQRGHADKGQVGTVTATKS